MLTPLALVNHHIGWATLARPVHQVLCRLSPQLYFRLTGVESRY